MSELWVPEPAAPLVAETARLKIVKTATEGGLEGVWRDALKFFESRHPPLYKFVRALNFEDKDDPGLDTDKTRHALRIAAVVAALAYLESGCRLTIEKQIFEIALLEAEFYGIPEAFVDSYEFDEELKLLMVGLRSTDMMQDGAEDGSYPEAMKIGAGATRLFLKVAAAA